MTSNIQIYTRDQQKHFERDAEFGFVLNKQITPLLAQLKAETVRLVKETIDEYAYTIPPLNEPSTHYGQ
jgi:hypothetical protein